MMSRDARLDDVRRRDPWSGRVPYSSGAVFGAFFFRLCGEFWAAWFFFSFGFRLRTFSPLATKLTFFLADSLILLLHASASERRIDRSPAPTIIDHPLGSAVAAVVPIGWPPLRARRACRTPATLRQPSSTPHGRTAVSPSRARLLRTTLAPRRASKSTFSTCQKALRDSLRRRWQSTSHMAESTRSISAEVGRATRIGPPPIFI